jgi:hypothetical protein
VTRRITTAVRQRITRVVTHPIVAVGVLAVAGSGLIWAIFVPLAEWLARHDVRSAGGAVWVTALQNARSSYLTLGAGILAAGALAYTARNYRLGVKAQSLAEEGHVTGRYSKAIGQGPGHRQVSAMSRQPGVRLRRAGRGTG